MNLRDEKRIHVAFEASLVFKGVFAVTEMLAGVFAYFTTGHFLLALVRAVTRVELTEDPRDFIANYLLHAVQHLPVSSRHFTAFYLFSHGLVKLWLIVGLWRRKPAYYPVAIAVFGAFIVYQIYRYLFTHSPLLLLISAVDVLVIALTWLEYRSVRRALLTRPK